MNTILNAKLMASWTKYPTGDGLVKWDRPREYRTNYDDVIKWKHFPRYWPFVWGIHRSAVNFPHKGQWRGPLIFFCDQHMNKRLSIQSFDWWFETPSRSLWRHYNVWLSRSFIRRWTGYLRHLSGVRTAVRTQLFLGSNPTWYRRGVNQSQAIGVNGVTVWWIRLMQSGITENNPSLHNIAHRTTKI